MPSRGQATNPRSPWAGLRSWTSPEEDRSFTDRARLGAARHPPGCSIPSRGTHRSARCERGADRCPLGAHHESTSLMRGLRSRSSPEEDRSFTDRARLRVARRLPGCGIPSRGAHRSTRCERTAERCPQGARHESTSFMCRPPFRAFAPRARSAWPTSHAWVCTASHGGRSSRAPESRPSQRPTSPARRQSGGVIPGHAGEPLVARERHSN